MTNPGDMPLSYQILPAVDATKAEDGGILDLVDEVDKVECRQCRQQIWLFRHPGGTLPSMAHTGDHSTTPVTGQDLALFGRLSEGR